MPRAGMLLVVVQEGPKITLNRPDLRREILRDILAQTAFHPPPYFMATGKPHASPALALKGRTWVGELHVYLVCFPADEYDDLRALQPQGRLSLKSVVALDNCLVSPFTSLLALFFKGLPGNHHRRHFHGGLQSREIATIREEVRTVL